jgi:hypothetical protein
VLAGAQASGKSQQRVRVVTPQCALVSQAEAAGDALDGVAFHDFDGDVRVEVTLLTHRSPDISIVRILGPQGPALQNFERVLNEAERSMTLPEVRKLAKLTATGVRTVTCSHFGDVPFAVSADGTLGAFFGSQPVQRLVDGAEPSFVTPRLRTALEGAQARGCRMTMDNSVPHGSGLVCGEPVEELIKLLTARSRRRFRLPLHPRGAANGRYRATRGHLPPRSARTLVRRGNTRRATLQTTPEPPGSTWSSTVPNRVGGGPANSVSQTVQRVL